MKRVRDRNIDSMFLYHTNVFGLSHCCGCDDGVFSRDLRVHRSYNDWEGVLVDYSVGPVELRVTCQPSVSAKEMRTCIGALKDDLPDLLPLQDMPTDEDLHYWAHRDEEEDEATVRAMLYGEDPQEAIKQHLHYGEAYVEEIIDD